MTNDESSNLKRKMGLLVRDLSFPLSPAFAYLLPRNPVVLLCGWEAVYKKNQFYMYGRIQETYW